MAGTMVCHHLPHPTQAVPIKLFSVSHQLCELVRSGIGIIVPVSQLRSQRARRICKCSEDIMKPTPPSAVPLPHTTAMGLLFMWSGSFSSPLQVAHQAGPWGSGLPGPVSTPLSDWREGSSSPNKAWVHPKLKKPIGHPTPETLRTGCTYPLYLCPTHPPRHTYNLSSGSIKTVKGPEFASVAT